MKEIEKLNLAKQEEMTNVSNMLKAAAMTYVASLASTILNLLRLIFMYRDRD